MPIPLKEWNPIFPKDEEQIITHLISMPGRYICLFICLLNYKQADLDYNRNSDVLVTKS